MTEPSEIHRVLDASLNRAAEGLRTLEEHARFVQNDASQSARLKRLRHDLATAAGRLSRVALLRSRDTGGDVGTRLSVPGQAIRGELIDVVRAASSRTMQSLRCLEEYGKLVDAAFGADVEQLRYRFYTLAADVELCVVGDAASHRGGERRRRLAESQLYALITAGSCDDDLTQRIGTLAAAGVDVFQIRDHDVDDRTLYQRCRVAAAVTRQTGTLLIVNDRVDIAVAADADGVHVGQDELPGPAVRRILGRDRLLGISTHDIDQLHGAVRDDADYVGCGPVFASQTKAFSHHVGVEFLQQVHAADTGLPAFAIGGIGPGNLADVLKTGFHRIAVTAAVAGDDPAAAAADLKRRLPSVRPTRAI